MTPRRVLSRIVTALAREWTQGDVHFHAHSGRPYPCYDSRCTNPHLDAG